MFQNLADKAGGANPTTPGIDHVGIMHDFEGSCYIRDAAEGIFDHVQTSPSSSHQEGAKVMPPPRPQAP